MMIAMKKIAVPEEVYLKPGDFHFGDETTCIHTLLGSCVSITLWHPSLRIGGMCHFMLPGRDRAATAGLDGRYADEAMKMFSGEIRKAGTHPSEYQAKLFGGGNMFKTLGERRAVDVAVRNVEMARRLLNDGGFRVHAEHVGGSGHRRIFFDLHDGNVWVKHEKISVYPFGGL